MSGLNRLVYNLLTKNHNSDISYGHVQGSPYFWGDICRENIKYVRNFVFAETNTLEMCPIMPYHDPQRPYVNYWFAASEGRDFDSFTKCISEQNQDRLEEEGGTGAG